MRPVIMITYIFALLLPMHLNASVEPVFHEAETEAEIRLNHILTLSNNDSNIFTCIIGHPDCDKSKDTYHELFTQDLRTAISNAEKSRVLKYCDGVYKIGEICGFDYCPIICGQDHPEKLLFRTVEQNEKMAIIEYAGFSSENSEAKYKLIKQGSTWIIDGILCGCEGFNINATISSK